MRDLRVCALLHRESDYGAGYLYHGLKSILGDNLVEYPWKVSYHGEVDKYTWPDGSPGVTGPAPWMTTKYGGVRVDNINELANMIARNEFDVIIASALRKTQVDTLRTLQGQLGGFPVPLILCDGEDFNHVQHNFMKEFGAQAMFKREYLKGEANVHPLPFSAPTDMYPTLPTEKSVDVMFSMGNTFPKRQEIFDAVNELRGEFSVYAALAPDYSRSDVSDVLLPWHEYVRKMASAKIAVSVRGFGWDTCRYWEIPPTGTMMLCDRVAIQIPNAFQEGVHIACYDKADDFKNKVRHLIANADKREAIAAAGKAHALKYHTCTARATYLVDKIRSMI